MTKNNPLKLYKHRIQDFLEGFQPFNIQNVIRRENKHVDRLATIGSQYDLLEHVEKEKEQHIKLVVRPVVLENCANWQVFDSDEQIVSLLQHEP